MNKVKRNIVVVGFTLAEKRSLDLPCIDGSSNHYFVDSIKDARKYQGYLLLIDNKENISLTLLDKKYRKIFNKYELIWIYNESYKDFEYKNKWSRLEMVGRIIFGNCGYQFGLDWDNYKYKKEHEEEKKLKYNINKSKKLDILYNYLKEYKTIKTNKIVSDLNISKRNIQRYMIDLNNIYHNIGYDYSLNEWYLIW